jgi:hypothetical protein
MTNPAGESNDGALRLDFDRAIMTRAPFIVIDGKLYRWKDILEPRRAQLAAAGAAQASQLALFATLHDDGRGERLNTTKRAVNLLAQYYVTLYTINVGHPHTMDRLSHRLPMQ